MASWLASYSRLFSRIWTAAWAGTAGTPEAPAALNMFPKLLDVPISTYFMVLAKIRRPPVTPSASTSRSFSSRITSAASLATSTADSTEMPTSAARPGTSARQLRGHGYRILAQEGFIIDGSTHGPLRAGETDRAAAWGAGAGQPGGEQAPGRSTVTAVPKAPRSPGGLRHTRFTARPGYGGR